MEIKTLAASGNLAMLAKQIDAVPEAGKYLAEAKYDGWRLIAHVTESTVEFYSRTGKRYDGRLPHVATELVKRFPAGTWLDGEAVAITFDSDGRVTNDWHTTQKVLSAASSALTSKVSYVVFDLIAHRGIDARELSMENRRSLLETAMEQVAAPVYLSMTMDATQANCAKLIAMGFEGMMLKRASSPYKAGSRGAGWFKLKDRGSEDVVIMGFEKGRDVGTVIFGQHRDGQLVERGRAKRKPALIPTTDAAWIGRVIEVQYSQVLKSGAFRHPRMLRVRDDKIAAQCVWA